MGEKAVDEDASALALQSTSDQDEAQAREHGRVIARYFKSLKENGVPNGLAADLTRYYSAWFLGEASGPIAFEVEVDIEDDEDEE